MKAIRTKKVDEWTGSEVKIVVNALLQQIATFLNRKQLGLPPPLMS